MSSTRASRPTSAPCTWKSLVPGPQMCHPEPLTTPLCLPRPSPSRDASGGGGWGPCGFDDRQHTPSPPGPSTRDRRQDQCPGDPGTNDHKLGMLETTGGLLSPTSGGLKSKISVGRAMHPPKDLGGNPSCLFQLLLAPGIPCGHISQPLAPVRMWPPLPTVTLVLTLRAQPGGPGRSQLGSCCLPASADSSQTWSHSQMLGTSPRTDLFSGATQPTTASVGSPLAGLDPNPATPAAGAWDPGPRPPPAPPLELEPSAGSSPLHVTSWGALTSPLSCHLPGGNREGRISHLLVLQGCLFHGALDFFSSPAGDQPDGRVQGA